MQVFVAWKACVCILFLPVQQFLSEQYKKKTEHRVKLSADINLLQRCKWHSFPLFFETRMGQCVTLLDRADLSIYEPDLIRNVRVRYVLRYSFPPIARII